MNFDDMFAVKLVSKCNAFDLLFYQHCNKNNSICKAFSVVNLMTLTHDCKILIPGFIARASGHEACVSQTILCWFHCVHPTCTMYISLFLTTVFSCVSSWNSSGLWYCFSFWCGWKWTTKIFRNTCMNVGSVTLLLYTLQFMGHVVIFFFFFYSAFRWSIAVSTMRRQ